jgi:hypothetical protein
MAGPEQAFRGVALAWNCRSQEEVDAAIAASPQRRRHGVQASAKDILGGYAGYFADPDGHLWDVAIIQVFR